MVDDDRPQDSLPLKIEDRDGDGGRVIALSGELDFASSEALHLALRRAEASRPEWILIDLEGVRFIDSTGLRALLTATKRAEASSYRLSLTRGTGYVADMFRLTALDQTLPFIDD
jgi:anti-anti-sigma factor